MTYIKTNVYITMEHNREPRNKPADIWWIDFQQESQEYTMGKEQSP